MLSRRYVLILVLILLLCSCANSNKEDENSELIINTRQNVIFAIQPTQEEIELTDKQIEELNEITSRITEKFDVDESLIFEGGIYFIINYSIENINYSISFGQNKFDSYVGYFIRHTKVEANDERTINWYKVNREQADKLKGLMEEFKKDIIY